MKRRRARFPVFERLDRASQGQRCTCDDDPPVPTEKCYCGHYGAIHDFVGGGWRCRKCDCTDYHTPESHHSHAATGDPR